MSFESRLSGRCAILKPVDGATDAWNNPVRTYAPPVVPDNLVAVPCFFYPETGYEEVSPQRVIAVQRLIFDFKRGTDIAEQDRIRYEDQLYEVTAVLPVGGNHHLKVRVEQIKVAT